MALYMYVCKKCNKKVYLNVDEFKLFIEGGRQHICPYCRKLIKDSL